MQIIVFSKRYASQTIAELIETAHAYDFDGYDLCIRPGHPVNPENVGETLALAANAMRQAGLDIPVVTSDTALTNPDDPTAEPILAAMDAADIGLIKLGYTVFDPLRQEYWSEVDRIRRNNEKWQALARQYQVKVCYHTHNERVMGINGAALCHLINGFDPLYIGAYLDPTHLVLEGEEFAFALAMVQRYLSVVSGKDVIKYRVEKNGHGSYGYKGVPAGEGFVDWTAVFSDLKRVGYDGPLSVHCEWFLENEDSVFDVLRREIKFFRSQCDVAEETPRPDENESR